MKIALTRDQVAIVDRADYDDLARHKWQASLNHQSGAFYAVRTVQSRNKKSREYMARRIMDLPRDDKSVVTHLNHNSLDNRRANLRVTDRRGQQENRLDQSRYGAGVCYHAHLKLKPFVASTYIDGRKHHIGCYASPKEAQRARKRYYNLCSQ